MGKCCCGFGHRELYKNIDDTLEKVIGDLITDGITCFYTGGMGDFDNQFSSVVRRYKGQNTEVKLILVKPYFSNEMNTNKEYYGANYDDVIIPECLIGCHYKSAITKRNHWIIEHSDVVLSGVYRDFGGAFEAIKYAEKMCKMIITVI